MLATKQKVLRRFWHPVMRVTDVDAGPRPFVLLGEPIVVWKGKDGTLSCLKDRCPHRTAKLSLGFIENNTLVCGYHGWTFNTAGACVRIPQAPSKNPTNAKGYKAIGYRVAERYGYVWVALDEPLTGIPELPEASSSEFRQIHQFYEPWKIGALRLMENSFDLAHVSFVHRATFGDVEQPSVDTNLQMNTHEFGFEYVNDFPVVVRGDVQQRAIKTTDGRTVRHTRSTYYVPFMRSLAITYPHGLTHVLITCATPMDDENSMILQWVYRNDTEADVKTEDVLAMDRRITHEDQAILESCDPDVPLKVIGREETHMASDRPGLIMRSLIADLLAKHHELEVRRDHDGAEAGVDSPAPAQRAAS